jgi:ATP-dependent exoDNAse (exonuclease V) alpha subunit
VLVLAPTGKAVDEALNGGAGDEGLTVAKALNLIADNQLRLDRTLVIVDEASMLGTPDLGTLLAAATQARAKVVLVGDAHQLSPVKARGGMFEQLCTRNTASRPRAFLSQTASSCGSRSRCFGRGRGSQRPRRGSTDRACRSAMQVSNV